MPRKKQFIASQSLEGLYPDLPSFAIKIMSSQSQIEMAAIADVHRHNYYMLFVLIDGVSAHMIDMEQVTLNAGEMGLIVPGQVHLALPEQTGTGWGIAFTADFLPLISLPMTLQGPVRLPGDELESVNQLICLMQKEYNDKKTQAIPLLQHYLSVLLLILQRNNTEAPAGNKSLLIRYRELVAAHYLEWTKPAQYAEALHISVDYLNEVVRQHSGQTASSLITERRVLEAKRLLLHAEESVKEIAWHLQFNEVSYFNRFFKQHTGYTPAAFRESVRDKSLSAPE
ncbi:helix-turn-helix domain-containing protein [Chitinophaga sancti]|uniref:AraC-type DNA-binding protein n=1 Tax=Chitinophaga sancti TaxID=1004 RepID=A0A1K1Q7A0_9BACT|nr:AraC family transcriptional regulator [Chitinophaga sancti]WQD61181.1 helix-turn-helix transcriptional regulator [Chitinophaga sancti]WQG86692.1 helix-turn-helix transcriptional regulator [Chitinophaga sancti]SFW55555.1 AraC-type DNA-binding protein [Chitinophaga sancti]